MNISSLYFGIEVSKRFELYLSVLTYRISTNKNASPNKNTPPLFSKVNKKKNSQNSKLLSFFFRKHMEIS